MADAVWLATVIEQRTAPPELPAPPERPAIEDVPASRTRPQPAPSSGEHDDGHDSGLVPERVSHLAVSWAAAGVSGEPVDGVALRSARAHGALSVRAYSRALRPLHRKARSRRVDDVVLDEIRTATRAVQDDLWLPQTKPAVERWLDLTLVVDASPSMPLWHSTVTAFETVLEQLGTFRTIQRCRLDATRGRDGRTTPVLRGGTPNAPARRTTALGRSDRRLVLVVTDGVGDRWQDPAFTSVLARWGRSMPIALVNLLPQRLWTRCGLELHRARLTARGTLLPNARWSLALPDAWLEPEPDLMLPKGTVPVPVFECQPRWLRRWAQLVGGSGDPIPATVLLTHELPILASTRVDARPAGWTAEEQVRAFAASASPQARRLATLLAAAPVSLTAAKAIQSELVPESDLVHLMETLASGLFEPRGAVNGPWDTIMFSLQPEVRRELLARARRSETVRVVKLLTTQLDSQSSAFGNLSDALDAPDTTPFPPDSADDVELVEIQRLVLRALSGPYLDRAERLAKRTDPTTTSVSDMNDAADRAALATDAVRPASVPDEPPAATASSVAPAGSGEPAAGGMAHPVLTREYFGRPTQDIPEIWGNIPPRNPNFTGRDELLDKLGRHLAEGTRPTAVLPSALFGLGGIGKTQTAVEYIYRHLGDYDLVWWIQASSASLITSDLTDLARVIGLPGSSEFNTAVPNVREALRRGDPFGRWLLVFDSADSMETVRKFFPTNTSGPGHLLITSRNPDWASVAEPLEVATFKRAESIELLGKRGPAIESEQDKTDADLLAEKLGDLPLAIEQAAAWRAETGMPMQEYLRLFDEKIADILPTTSSDGYERSVAAAWNVSFDELGKRNAAAHQLLQVCAFFSPEPISRHLFSGVRSTPIRSDLDRALRDPVGLGRAIRDITAYSLAKIDYRNNSIQLHRLVQLVLRNRMTGQRRQEMRHGAHILLANHDPNDPLSPSQRQRYQEVLPHIYTAELIDCREPWTRELVINLMRFLYRWGDHDGAMRLAEEALRQWTARLGPRDPQTLQVASELGYYYWITGRYDRAAELNRDTLAVRRELDGENAEETLNTQLAVAGDLRAAGEFAEAASLSAEVLDKTKALLREDDPVTLNAARVHCICLRLVGRYKDAAALDEQTLKGYTEILGQDHPRTLSARAGWILDRREMGDYLWAGREQEELANRAREIHGEDNADTLRRIAYLAVAKRKAGDHEGALKLSTEVLDRFKVRYGLDNFNAMACALGLSIDLRHADDLRGAHELGKDVVERYRRNLGDQHPYTVVAQVDNAVTLRYLGLADSALELDEQSLARLRATVGTDHPHTVICSINLGSDLAALGRRDEALAATAEAHERSAQVFGPNHPTTLAATLNLVIDLRAVGRDTEAEPRHVEVLTRYRQVLGEQHRATTSAGQSKRADCDIDPLPL